MKDSVHKLRKINIGTTVLLAVVLLLTIFITIYYYLTNNEGDYSKKLHLVCSAQKEQVERGVWTDKKYPILLVELNGTVSYADSQFVYEKGDYIPPETIMDEGSLHVHKDDENTVYKTVIEKNNQVKQFAAFSIPKAEIGMLSKKEQAGKIFWPVFIGLILSLAISIGRTLYINIWILKPIEEITMSARAIIAGNYALEVVRTHEKRPQENEIGRLIYSFELMRDELYEKQIREEGLKKAQQELISCISHDLKTPLSTIKAYSEGIRDGIAKDAVQKEEYIEVIIRKTNLIIGMIEELLVYSNTQLKQLSIQKKEVFFVHYVREVLCEMAAYVQQRGGEFEWQITVEECLLAIDEKRMTEVLYNLIENSLKYKSEERLNIKVDISRQDEWVFVTVYDNGIGITAADIPLIFEKFYRAEKSRSSSVPGSGLGLSICKYIMEEHNGSIACYAQQKGSKIVLRLPIIH